MKSAYPAQPSVKPYRTEQKTEADANVKARGIASDLIPVASEDVLLRPMEEPFPLIFDVKAEGSEKGKVFVVVDEVFRIPAAALLEETDPVLWTGDEGDMPDVVRKGAFFHRVFKQLEGIPPAAYHKKVMGKWKIAR
jgi:hypothetical protein